MSRAGRGDVIILAGKGHEDYQEIKGVKHHMDERSSSPTSSPANNPLS